MNTKLYGNNIVEIIDNNILIKDVDDALNLFCMIENCSTIILKKENIVDDFFNLATGIAGEILQKFSNYRMRMAIIGDFDNLKSKALKDFIRESNKTKRIVFIKTLNEALKIFDYE
ncbi:MAG: DUF4180 domain-containing protein [Prevotellaceae bacterium]|jgi:hypothetical protein|nr:DUF4180 domain-containing protein [Prevotellaceae bacterium]